MNLALRPLLLLLLCTASTLAAADPLAVTAAWARPTPPGAPNGAAYLTLGNPGDEEIVIMAVTSPIAESAEIHRSVMRDGTMGMVPVAGLIVPAGDAVELAPGGLHIMLMGLREPLAEGSRFPLTFAIAGNGQVTVDVQVGEPGQEHVH